MSNFMYNNTQASRVCYMSVLNFTNLHHVLPHLNVQDLFFPTHSPDRSKSLPVDLLFLHSTIPPLKAS